MEDENELFGVGEDYSQQETEQPDLYDDFLNEEQTSEEKPQDSSSTSTSDYLDKLLVSKGVDRNKVRIENEDGEIEEWNFDDLDDDTKYGILSSGDDDYISDDEINTLNYLRQNQMSLKDFAEYQQKMAVEEYIKQNSNTKYTVDQLSDDDLFKFELREQMPELTDEEVEDQLNKAKESESFFNKKIAALRKEYKDLEDAQRTEQETQEAQQKENQFNAMASSVVEAARATSEMNGMILDDDDKEEVLSFLLDRDPNGQTQFYKMFSDPKKLFELGWFALKGNEAYEALTDYYKNEIAKTRKQNKNEQKTAKTIRRPQKKSAEEDYYGLDSVFS